MIYTVGSGHGAILVLDGVDFIYLPVCYKISSLQVLRRDVEGMISIQGRYEVDFPYNGYLLTIGDFEPLYLKWLLYSRGLFPVINLNILMKCDNVLYPHS